MIDYWRSPEEIEQERKTESLVRAYLARPPKKPYQYGHEFSPLYRICRHCDRSEIEVHADRLRCKFPNESVD